MEEFLKIISCHEKLADAIINGKISLEEYSREISALRREVIEMQTDVNRPKTLEELQPLLLTKVGELAELYAQIEAKEKSRQIQDSPNALPRNAIL